VISKCYLGPRIYDYVSRLHSHEGLVIKGLSDPERILDYLDAIINYIKELPALDPGLAKKIKARARKLLQQLNELQEKELEPQIYGVR